MNFRKTAPFIIIMLFIAVILQVGCDTLVTEINTEILVDSTLAIRCFDCHNDTDNLLIRPRGQFNNSAHADFSLLDNIYDKDGNECGRACHTHEGFLVKVDSTLGSTDSYSAINCFTCHLPHTGEYGTWNIDTLRSSDKIESRFGATLGAGFYSPSNSCVHCHASTQSVAGTDSLVELDADFGPHVSPQTDIISGKNGYFVSTNAPPVNTHLENGCIKCHYGNPASGQGGQGYAFAEHTFRLEDENSMQQYTNTCGNANNACHLGSEITDFYDRPSILKIDTLSNSVKSLLASFEIIDSADTSGLTYTIGDSVPRIHAEAYYNYLLYKNDRSRGIHNAGFVTTLLRATATVLDSLPPVGFFTVDDSLGCFGLPVTFTPTLLGYFDTLYWNFGDGRFDTTTVDTPITNIYSAAGLYTVSLTSSSIWSKDSAGFIITSTTSDIFTKTDFITIDGPPVADFTIDTDSICTGDPVTFTSTSQSLLPATYVWDFGDSSTAVTPDATHAYTTPGLYSISLIVTTDCDVDTLIKIDTLTVLAGPTAQFTYAQNPAPDTLTYQFTDASIGASGWSWEFFEGIGSNVVSVGSSQAQDTTFTFPNSDISRRAILTVINANNCIDIDTMIIAL